MKSRNVINLKISKTLQGLTLTATVPVTFFRFTEPIMSIAHAKYLLTFRKYEK